MKRIYNSVRVAAQTKQKGDASAAPVATCTSCHAYNITNIIVYAVCGGVFCLREGKKSKAREAPQSRRDHWSREEIEFLRM